MPGNYDYTDSGFNKLGRRRSAHEPAAQETTLDESSVRNRHVDATAISSGKGRSANDMMIIDWDRPEISFSDRARNRVQIGNLDGLDIFGLRVVDNSGNTRFESSSDRNFSDIDGKKVTVGTEGDDFTDIQKAIDYIHDLGGGTVFIKAGTYQLESTITLYSNINLVGENLSTIIDFGNNRLCIEVISTENNTIESLKVQNSICTSATPGESNVGSTTNYGAISLDNGNNIRIFNCSFTGNSNSSPGVLDGNDISAQNSTRVYIQNNISTSSCTLASLDNCVASEVTGNYYFLNTLPTLAISCVNSLGVLIQNNYISACAAAIFTSGDNVTISENFVDKLSGQNAYAIKVSGTYLTISNNSLFLEPYNATTGSNRAIWLTSSTNCIVIGNNIHGANTNLGYDPQIGIRCDSADAIAISSNSVVDQGVGVIIDADSDRLALVGNIIYGNDTNLTNNGTNTTLAGNVTS